MPKPRLTRLILWVHDPALLSGWYCNAFGWKEVVNEIQDGWIELDAGGFILALHGGADLKARRWPKIQIAVDNVMRYRDKLIELDLKVSTIHKWKHLIWC